MAGEQLDWQPIYPNIVSTGWLLAAPLSTPWRGTELPQAAAVRASQYVVEVLEGGGNPVRTSQFVAEVVEGGGNPLRASQYVAEAVEGGGNPLRISQVVFEAIVSFASLTVADWAPNYPPQTLARKSVWPAEVGAAVGPVAPIVRRRAGDYNLVFW